MVESLAQHEEPRIRAYAADVIQRDAIARRELAELNREEERVAAPAAAFHVEDTSEAELWDSAYADDLPF